MAAKMTLGQQSQHMASTKRKEALIPLHKSLRADEWFNGPLKDTIFFLRKKLFTHLVALALGCVRWAPYLWHVNS